LSNLKFALAVEPGNLDLIHDVKRCQDMRSQGQLGKLVNPFLRASVPAVAQAARGTTPPHRRIQWKNEFK
jgi:hydroxyacylglutathione hydrolase